MWVAVLPEGFSMFIFKSFNHSVEPENFSPDLILTSFTLKESILIETFDVAIDSTAKSFS